MGSQEEMGGGFRPEMSGVIAKEVILDWVGPCQYWLMKSKNGLALQEIKETPEPFRLLDCLGMLMAFPNKSKDKPQRYRITIEHLGDA